MEEYTRWEFCEVEVGVKTPKVTWYPTPQNKNINANSEQSMKQQKPNILEVALEWLSQYGFQLLNSPLALMLHFFTFIYKTKIKMSEPPAAIIMGRILYHLHSLAIIQSQEA